MRVTGIWPLIWGLVVCLLYSGVSWPADAKVDKRYAITLVSSLQPIRPEELPDTAVLKQYHVYSSGFVKDGKRWYRLRLGFFDGVSTARPVLRQMRLRYHDAWVNTVNEKEYALALNSRIKAVSTPEIASETTSAVVPTADPAAALLDQARQALTAGETAAAIPLLQQVMVAVKKKADEGQQPQLSQAQLALELTGVAQERLGDMRTAMATYRRFLARYKEGDAVVRVQQRLAVLETISSPAPKAMPKLKEEPTSMEWGGSFSQFSNRDVRFLDGGGYEATSMLFNDLGISSRYRSERVDIRSRLDTSYRYNFRADNTTDDQLRLSSMFVDVRDKKYDVAAKLGRQSASSGGVLGRFDGALISYRADPHSKYNLVAGYPVELSSTSIIDETDRHFVGMSVDLGTFAKAWDLNIFGIDQRINGITDRQAMGGEVRYFDRKQSHMLLLDYDVSYSVVNSILALSNWFLPNQTVLNIVLDSRLIPVMSTTNALIGRTELGIDEMLTILSEDEIRQLARDRTSRSYSATFAVSHPLSDKYQLNADVSVFDQTDTPASGGVPAVQNGGEQYTYSMTMIGSSVFKEGDISIAGLRFSDTVTSAITTLNLNVRYPLTRAWRMGPTMIVDYRNNDLGVDQVSVRPSLRIDYRWLTNTTFDAEIALLHLKDLGSSASGSDTDLFFELGYRVDF